MKSFGQPHQQHILASAVAAAAAAARGAFNESRYTFHCKKWQRRRHRKHCPSSMTMMRTTAVTCLLLLLPSPSRITSFYYCEAFYPGPQAVDVAFYSYTPNSRRGSNLLQLASSSSSMNHSDSTPESNNNNNNDNNDNSHKSSNDENPLKKKNIPQKNNHKMQQQQQPQNQSYNATTDMEILLKRVTQLEQLVAQQNVEIKRLQRECEDLTHAAGAFARVVELLRQAGLPVEQTPSSAAATASADNENDDTNTKQQQQSPKNVIESFDDSLIFGKAPANVIEAADVAGASILAGLLAGKQRMLVDVRDADLSSDPDTLVQFIELAVLPVAAGLEGLKSKRNRLKIVFPTVSQLLEYRKTMALAAPEVVALSTLGFDPVEPHDNLVVLIAPAPDDDESLQIMNALLRVDDDDDDDDDSSSDDGDRSNYDTTTAAAAAAATNSSNKKKTKPLPPPIQQPVVVLNHHMIPLPRPVVAQFEVAYHLRLLSVQYMAAAATSATTEDEFLAEFVAAPDNIANTSTDMMLPSNTTALENTTTTTTTSATAATMTDQQQLLKDAALEAAMEHARQIGMHQGMTRAMVVRAYPNPWHVFVDTSPDTDADFEVAATFDQEPTQDQVNRAIVECLEGSEEEDELVAQQMQQALETGQLDRVSEMLADSMGIDVLDDDSDDEDEEEEDGDNDLWRSFDSDSV